MKKAILVWLCVAGLVVMGCSPAFDNAESLGSVGTLGDSWVEIWDWYDLDAIRDNLDGNYILMTDLDSTTAGYEELAGPDANDGKGWEPIGTSDDPFAGTLDGQGHEIRGLFANRPAEPGVGLFGFIGDGGVVNKVGTVNVDVTGNSFVGGLVGRSNGGTVHNSHVSGNLAGGHNVGGVVGYNRGGNVSNSFFAGSVTGWGEVGGLVGYNRFDGTVSNSFYDLDEVLINGESLITIGALYSEDFEEWLANDKFLDVNDRLSQEDGYYVINSVGDFRQLLAFGQDYSLKFRLNTDLNLANEVNFYIPYLAGEFDGDDYEISNFTLDLDSVHSVALFGFLATGGTVSDLGVEEANIAGGPNTGSLVGWNEGTVSDCQSTGIVTGRSWVGGLVGWNHGNLSNCFFDGSVNGHHGVGGLVGKNTCTVSNSHYDYDSVPINGESLITIGALFAEDFEQWLANDKFLDVNDRLSQEDGYYAINSVGDFKQLLAFGQDESLKFVLKDDLDLGMEANFYVPYLAGEFHGNGHSISNVSLDFDAVVEVGLIGLLRGKITDLGAENVNVTGPNYVGGLLGDNRGGIVSRSYSTGSVTGGGMVGGLVGENLGAIEDSYSSASVTGGGRAGGLTGWNNEGTVSNSYAAGSVTGHENVGGLVGLNYGTVSNSFWDIETSGTGVSDGGTGKTTAQMQDIATFVDAGWDIGTTSLADPTGGYPFLAWQLGGTPTWYIHGEPAVPTVTTQAATDITTDSATLNMEFAVGDYSPVDVRFNWREEGTATWETTAWSSREADGTHAETLTGLDADTTYEFRAQLGYDTTVIDGAVLTFTTEDEIPTVCVATDTGTGIACFTASHGTVEELEALPVPPDPPAGFTFPHGMFSFKVTELDYHGQTATITIELPTAVPAGTKWWKYQDDAWHELPIGTTAEPNIITITLTDGVFPGDADKTADGTIIDPGGPGYPEPPPPVVVGWEGSPINKLAVVAPWIALLAAIAGVSLLVLRRRRDQI